jgi:hypothetical protein
MTKRAIELSPGDMLITGKVVARIKKSLGKVTVYFTDGTELETVFCQLFELKGK